MTSHSLAYNTPLHSVTIAFNELDLEGPPLLALISLSLSLSVFNMLVLQPYQTIYNPPKTLGSCLGVSVSSRTIISPFFAASSYFSYKTPELEVPLLCFSNSWRHFLYS